MFFCLYKKSIEKNRKSIWEKFSFRKMFVIEAKNVILNFPRQRSSRRINGGWRQNIHTHDAQKKLQAQKQENQGVALKKMHGAKCHGVQCKKASPLRTAPIKQAHDARRKTYSSHFRLHKNKHILLLRKTFDAMQFLFIHYVDYNS